MYATQSARPRSAQAAVILFLLACVVAVGPASTGSAWAQQLAGQSLVYKLGAASQKLELTTNTSRILTLDKNIPRVQVNNPDLLAVTPLSANQVQISAKKAGVTQVNLWDEDGNIHTVDVLIYGDVKELEVALQTQFPNSSIKVYRYSESLVLKGFVDQPEHVSQIVQLSSDYAPKVINNITVGGVQQVLLKVRVMEVSRTKLRELGVDWAYFGGSGDFAINSVSGLIQTWGAASHSVTSTGETFAFGIVDGANDFFAFLNALQQNDIAKILAEPNLVAVSGRPAQFNVGGEFPILVPQSLGTTTIEFKKYGTQVDFLPIVLGNGNIRLEVRPRVSELDPTASVTIQDITVPGLRVREVDTAVEMKAGQTFALAGLVQERVEGQTRGLPYISDVPILGVPFRRIRERVNEIELLILVTPEFVDAMEPHEVACGGPGYVTTSPDSCSLYCGYHLEVPVHENPIRGMTACGECSNCGCGPNGGCGCNGPAGPGPIQSYISDGVPMPGGTGYDDSYGAPMPINGPNGQVIESDSMTLPAPMSVPEAEPLPANHGAAVAPESTAPRPYSPERQPTFVRNATSPNNPHAGGESSGLEGGLIGPIGYDAD